MQFRLFLEGMSIPIDPVVVRIENSIFLYSAGALQMASKILPANWLRTASKYSLLKRYSLGSLAIVVGLLFTAVAILGIIDGLGLLAIVVGPLFTTIAILSIIGKRA